MEEAENDIDENALVGARKKQKTTYQERVEQNRVRCLLLTKLTLRKTKLMFLDFPSLTKCEHSTV